MLVNTEADLKHKYQFMVLRRNTLQKKVIKNIFIYLNIYSC